jgi:membrane-associated phospholipid phosphatase
MDLKNGRPGVEALFMAYNVILAGVWVMRAAQEPVTPFMVFLHVGLAFLFIEVRRPGTDAPAYHRFLSGFYPFVIWGLAWIEIGWLYNLTQPVVHDGSISAIDLAMFGTHLNEDLAVLAPWGHVRNLMGFSYLSYYLLILGPIALLALRKRARQLEYHTLVLMGTYLACFVVYLVMPVVGPRDIADAAGSAAPVVGGLFGPVMQALFAAGDSLGTAFPSSHCAASVASAILVRRHFGAAAGGWAGLWAGFIVVSTVYTNNHYFIDAVAGVALAFITQKVLSIYAAWPAVKSVPAAARVSEPQLENPAPIAGESRE